jgi:NADH-quinone oxidoreductase subunit J
MSGAGVFVFVACALAALLSAVGTVVVKSPIRAAMCLLVHIVSLSGLFLSLHAHLLAALQVLVYAGAVVVLFVFVIMLIGPAVPEQPTTRGLVLKSVAASLMGMLTLAIAAVVIGAAPERPIIEACKPGQGAECGQFGGVEGFALHLFEQAVVPFELVSILLTVAIIGAIAVARGRTAAEVEAARTRLAEKAASDAAKLAREQALSAEVAAHGGH